MNTGILFFRADAREAAATDIETGMLIVQAWEGHRLGRGSIGIIESPCLSAGFAIPQPHPGSVKKSQTGIAPAHVANSSNSARSRKACNSGSRKEIV